MSAIILIAAGDPDRLLRLRRLVENQGAAVIPSTDPVDTMRVFVRREPDMVVLHLDSRHEIGLDLCRDMKKLRTARHRALLVVGPRHARQVAFDAGCDLFVPRQNEAQQLSLAVHRFLNAHRSKRHQASIEVEALG